MGKHRTKLAILANILSVIDSDRGVRKTRIMYKAYLSYGLLTRYLKKVLDARLATCEDENCYRLTSKGKEFLEKFNEYNKSRETIKEKINHVEDQKLMLEKMSSSKDITTVS